MEIIDKTSPDEIYYYLGWYIFLGDFVWEKIRNLIILVLFLTIIASALGVTNADAANFLSRWSYYKHSRYSIFMCGSVYYKVL